MACLTHDGVGSHGVGVGGYAECACYEGWSGANCTTKAAGAAPQQATAAAVPALADRVMCPDAISSCAPGQTCGQFTGGRWGCCPLAKAVLCDSVKSGNSFCCPEGYSCDGGAGVCYK